MRRLVLLFAFLLIGCGGGGENPAEPSGLDVTGNWSGTWTSYNNVDSGTVLATLSQSSILYDYGTFATVEGTATVSGSPCFSIVSVIGTIWNYGDAYGSAGLSLSSGDTTINFNASIVVPGSMSGGYAVAGGACDGDAGKMRLVEPP